MKGDSGESKDIRQLYTARQALGTSLGFPVLAGLAWLDLGPGV